MDATLAKAINDLLDVCERCTGALQSAAQHAREPELRALFARRADEYERANGELQALLVEIGGRTGDVPPAEDAADTAMAAGWGTSNDLALLEGCERLELAALECHGRALRAAPPQRLQPFLDFQRATAEANLACVRAIVHAAVARQCEDVRRNHAHVDGLREHVRKRARGP